jgi:hypothetical protein
MTFKNKMPSHFRTIMKNKNQDWGNLSKYKDENTQIKAHFLGEKKIVFFGDSITAAWETYDPEFFANKKKLTEVSTVKPLHKCYCVLELM